MLCTLQNDVYKEHKGIAEKENDCWEGKGKCNSMTLASILLYGLGTYKSENIKMTQEGSPDGYSHNQYKTTDQCQHKRQTSLFNWCSFYDSP